MDGGRSGLPSLKMEKHPLPIGISLQQGRVLLPLMLIVFLFSEYLAMASPGSSFVLTPSSLDVLEGSTVNMSCKFQGNITGVWYINWYHNGTRKLANSSQMPIITDKAAQVSNLTLKRVDIEDSGTYQCQFGNSEGVKSVSNSTVTVREITDLMVNQTPEADLKKMEGGNVTMDCSFRPVANLSTMYVQWHKNTIELSNNSDSGIILQDLEKGLTSLTVMNLDQSHSGFYQCKVGSSLRNRSGLGHGCRLDVIAKQSKDPDSKEDNETGSGNGFVLGVGAGAGILLLLLLLGFLGWRYKKKKAEGVTSDTVTEEDKKQLPLSRQASEVTYVDLNFHRRKEAEQAGEVIYAEVKRGSKQQDGNKSRARR
ncbi:tyrosine-protein kinase-like otk isoform X2 [Anolis sagrei]|uniref:tyrosine-protein kinase-like otk isoform X2 n=1 Tax=Anolis sagrei TaxID=38937 RepID=UPI00352123EE